MLKRCQADMGEDWCHTICDRDCFADSMFCLEHTDKEVLAEMIRQKNIEIDLLQKEIDELFAQKCHCNQGENYEEGRNRG